MRGAGSTSQLVMESHRTTENDREMSVYQEEMGCQRKLASGEIDMTSAANAVQGDRNNRRNRTEDYPTKESVTWKSIVVEIHVQFLL